MRPTVDALSLTQVKPSLMAPPRVSAFRPDQLWQQAREPMFWLDAALRVGWVNQAWEALTGHPAESVVGSGLRPHGPTRRASPPTWPRASSLPRRPSRAGPPGWPSSSMPSGARLWRRIEFWPFRDQADALLGILGQVREAERSAQRARFAGPRASRPAHGAARPTASVVRHRVADRYRPGARATARTGPAGAARARPPSSSSASREPASGWWHGRSTRQASQPDQALVRSTARPCPPRSSSGNSSPPRSRPGRRTSRGPPTRRPPGPRLSLADGASLVIGDILALPRDLQARLADALDGRVRVIATTSGDPEAAVKSERLRPELYYTMTVLVLRLHAPARAQGGPAAPGTAPAGAGQPADRLAVRRLLAAGRRRDSGLRLARQRRRAGPRDRRGSRPGLGLVPRERTGSPWIEVGDLPASIRGHLGAAYLPPVAAQPVKPLDELLTEIERRLIETALSKSRQNKSAPPSSWASPAPASTAGSRSSISPTTPRRKTGWRPCVATGRLLNREARPRADCRVVV